MSLKRLRPTVAMLALCGLLGGCISLLPKTRPAQLYRFGVEPASTTAARPAGAPAVAEGAIIFDSAAATDRILAVNGAETSYIEGARWVSPAPTLFEEALIRAFQGASAGPELAPRGSGVRAAARLDLDVQAFETRYDRGLDQAPLVVVRLRATLIRPGDRALLGQQLFEIDQRAADNRVGAIVEAYGAAVREGLDKLVAWTAGAGVAQAG